MKLVYISRIRLPTEKAHGYQIMATCAALADLGVEVELWYAKREQPDALRGIDPFNYYGISPNFVLKQLWALDIHAIAPDSSFIRNTFWLPHLVSFIPGFLWHVKAMWNQPDVVLYTRDFYLAMLLLSLRNRFRFKAPLVLEAHSLPGKRIRHWAFSLFSHLDALVVITHQLKKLYLEYTELASDRIYVAPDGVDLNRFQIRETQEECRQRLNLPLDRSIITYVGRFHTLGEEKGLPELVTSLKFLNEVVEPPPLLLCVGGPMEAVPAYQAVARQHNISQEQMYFVDRVPGTELVYWIRASDVAVIPFPWNEHMAYFTSPMKLFEYMAAGVPIVASDLPSLREVLQDKENAILVRPGDPKALAEGIQVVLLRPNIAKKITEQAQRDIQSYTWEARARTILKALRGKDAK